MKTLQATVGNLAAIGMLTLLAISPAYGQGGALNANIPFNFEAGEKSLPAGTYKLEIVKAQSVVISTRNAVQVQVHVITQLGGNNVIGDAGLVFDEFEGHHVLSELWIPGQDGVLLHSTSKQHTHQMVIAVVATPKPNLSGRSIFERSCVRCHGANGNGNAAADKFFRTALPRLGSAYVQSKSDEELKDIISHGRRNMDPVRVGQASVQHLLAPASVDAVIAYVRTLKQQ